MDKGRGKDGPDFQQVRGRQRMSRGCRERRQRGGNQFSSFSFDFKPGQKETFFKNGGRSIPSQLNPLEERDGSDLLFRSNFSGRGADAFDVPNRCGV
jgi:hypothetical protein